MMRRRGRASRRQVGRGSLVKEIPPAELKYRSGGCIFSLGSSTTSWRLGMRAEHLRAGALFMAAILIYLLGAGSHFALGGDTGWGTFVTLDDDAPILTGKNGKVKATAKKGEVLEVIEVRGDWYIVRPNRGWIHKQYVNPLPSSSRSDGAQATSRRVGKFELKVGTPQSVSISQAKVFPASEIRQCSYESGGAGGEKRSRMTSTMEGSVFMMIRLNFNTPSGTVDQTKINLGSLRLKDSRSNAYPPRYFSLPRTPHFALPGKAGRKGAGAKWYSYGPAAIYEDRNSSSRPESIDLLFELPDSPCTLVLTY